MNFYASWNLCVNSYIFLSKFARNFTATLHMSVFFFFFFSWHDGEPHWTSRFMLARMYVWLFLLWVLCLRLDGHIATTALQAFTIFAVKLCSVRRSKCLRLIATSTYTSCFVFAAISCTSFCYYSFFFTILHFAVHECCHAEMKTTSCRHHFTVLWPSHKNYLGNSAVTWWISNSFYNSSL